MMILVVMPSLWMIIKRLLFVEVQIRSDKPTNNVSTTFYSSYKYSYPDLLGKPQLSKCSISVRFSCLDQIDFIRK